MAKSEGRDDNDNDNDSDSDNDNDNHNHNHNHNHNGGVRSAEIDGGISDVVEAITAAGGSPDSCWYRGVRGDYPLVPTRFRTQDGPAGRASDKSAFDHFRTRGLPFVERGTRSVSDWYTLASHYGLRTRLLDWTSSLDVALFFATRASTEEIAFYEMNRGDFVAERLSEEPSFLWVLVPQKMNVELQEETSIPILSDEQIEKSPKRPNAAPPLAVLPSMSNIRLIAQTGYFTLHHNEKPLDSFAEGSNWLLRLKLNHQRIAAELHALGKDDLSVFPSLESLARKLNRTTTTQDVLREGAKHAGDY